MSEPVYILKLGLQNVRCFGENAELDLSDGNGGWRQWTVIVGDNGLGKTTLLQVLAGLNLHDDFKEFSLGDSGKKVIEYLSFDNLDKLQNELKVLKDKSQIDASFLVNQDVETVSITGHFFPDGGKGIRYIPSKNFTPVTLFGYGANRFMSNNSLTNLKFKGSATLFDDNAKLINAEEWLLQIDYAASRDSSVKAFAQKRKELIQEILVDILPDIKEVRFTEPTKGKLTPDIEFSTSFGWVKIHELSLGYKTMVAWMVDLAARMFEHYSDKDEPLEQPAIVLVDEIDLHLHPKWQRKIFDYLSEKFPKTQFVVTAHSPLVVQSAPKDANIVVLRKEGDHVVIDNDVESVQSWRLDQILDSDLFGFIPTRGPEVTEWMKEREDLLRKQTLDADEKQRLDELNGKAHGLPTANNIEDREAMDIIRKAADYLKNKVGVE